MSALKNHYKTLGVGREVTKKGIKKAYLELAKKYHPDVNPSPAAKKTFQRIQEAYGVLSDDRKRKDYDLETANTGGGGGAQQGGAGFSGSAAADPWATQAQTASRRSYDPPEAGKVNHHSGNLKYGQYAGFPGGGQNYWKFYSHAKEQEEEAEFRRQKYERLYEQRKMSDQKFYEKYNFDRVQFVVSRVLPLAFPLWLLFMLGSSMK